MARRSGNKGGKKKSSSKTASRPTPAPRRRFKRDHDAPAPSGPKISTHALARHAKQAIQRWLQVPEVSLLPPQSNDSTELALDPWQRQAVDLLIAGESVVVDAPTTAGKTRVVEAYFNQNLHDPTFRAAYTTPVKSLTNDKLLEFREMFGAENVGISTGDIKENLSAPIVVATLESYRNSLLGTEPDLGRTMVVFDEYHFMQDSSRGSAWEESIILSPPECQLLLLSASVANAEDFCAWLVEIRKRPCQVVRTLERPVPLEDLVYVQGDWILARDIPERSLKHIDPRKQRIPEPFAHFKDRVFALEDLGLFPTIIYTGRRLSAETLAYQLRQGAPLMDEQARTKITERMAEIHEQNHCLRFVDPQLRNLLSSYGIAFHHSGLAAPVRVMIEKLLKEGLLRVCTATMGLSIGINFSVRSAMIADYSRPDEKGLTTYTPSEVLQMLGRAGRRGRDQVGFSLWPNIESYAKFTGAKRQDCYSSLKMDPATLLGLLGRYPNLRDIESFYEKSFDSYHQNADQLNLFRKEPLQRFLRAENIPCPHPAVAYQNFRSKVDLQPCQNCNWRKDCHPHLRRLSHNPLARLQLHLAKIGALQADHRLSKMGSISRFLPQPGGLLVALWIDQGKIDESNLMATVQLMAALSLARFKSPGCPDSYRFPFDIGEVESELERLYPIEIFPDMYDDKAAKYGGRQYRDFNPWAGFALKRWLQDAKWKELEEICTHEKFGTGDLMNLMYRSSTFLQSLAQGKIPRISEMARALRLEVLKEPMTVSIFNQ